MARIAAESTSVRALNRRIAVWFAIFTALAGGLLGAVVDLIAGDPAADDFWPRLWTSFGLAAASAAALARGWGLWRRRDRLLNERGTCYVVDSPMATWTPDEKNAFLTEASSQFVDVMHVPGPTGLSKWKWPIDHCAQRWSDAVDDLVLSFRSVWVNDDNSTPNSVVCWAPYPVALAWTARVTQADRNLPLAVRQRPSTGRAGRIGMPDWGQSTHDFSKAPATISPRGEIPPVREATISFLNPSIATAPNPPRSTVTLLLVRTTAQDWAGITPADDDALVTLCLDNRSGQDWGRGFTARFHELRLLAPGHHAWDTYPDIVAEIVDWIAKTAHPTGVNLIGMIVPQEVGMGIGVQARLDEQKWPAQLWPIVKPGRDLPAMVPGLDLGWKSLHLDHSDGPRP